MDGEDGEMMEEEPPLATGMGEVGEEDVARDAEKKVLTFVDGNAQLPVAFKALAVVVVGVGVVVLLLVPFDSVDSQTISSSW